jgi:ABC-type transport system involved in multi-copper enzyme maturation permease subunit
MRQWTAMLGHFAFQRLVSYQNLMFFLLLITVLFAAIASMHSDRSLCQRGYSMSGPVGLSMPLAVLNPGTAHQTIWAAISYRFLHSAQGLGGGLLPMRFAMRWLVFILPVVGLAASFSSVSGAIESGVMQSLLVLPVQQKWLGLARLCGECCAFTLTVLLGLGVIALVAARGIGISWTAAQFSRAMLCLAVVGLYVTFFLLLGSWISAKARRSSKALWIVAGIFVGVFIVHVTIDGALALRSQDFPVRPEVPTAVSSYLQQQSLRPSGTSGEAPAVVTAYFEELEVYSTAVSTLLRGRYRLERWLNTVSMTHLFLEICGQLLQDGFPNATDVVYRTDSEDTQPGVLHSLGTVAQEIAWLIVLVVLMAIANARTLSKLEV